MEMTKLRQESRAELAKVLTPSQLEEFLLRYSSTAYQMRNELRGLEFTPDEFRALFRARDVVEQNPDVFYTGSDPVKIHQKQVLEEQRETAIREAIGDGRYAMYVLNKDPLFRQSQTTAEQLGAPADLVFPIYRINQLTDEEQKRIRNDATLSAEEKIDALATTQAEQQKSLEKILGPEFLQKYLQVTNTAPR
jgi:hypothetical protein